jgi:hypothetical protein
MTQLLQRMKVAQIAKVLRKAYYRSEGNLRTIIDDGLFNGMCML